MNHYTGFNPYLSRDHNQRYRRRSTRCVSNSRSARTARCAAALTYLPWSSVAGSLSVKRGWLSSVLVDGAIGRLISPGHRLRITSPESFVQESLAGGGRRYGHCDE